MAAYDADGKLKLTASPGSGRVGLYAPDGSIYYTTSPGSGRVGSMAPDGSIYITDATGSAFSSVYAPDGSIRVTSANEYNGAWRVSGISSVVASWNASTSTLAMLTAIVNHTRTSLATMFDSTGKLTYAPNNLALNTATLGTQSVTVQVGVNYLISFASGGGSIALSGAGAGTVTSASPVKITASTTTLTLTVTGTVTNAVVAAVTYETSPRAADQVITTASAYYGPRIDYDPNTLAVKGLLIEEARTNYAYQGFNLSDAGWATTGGSKAGATDLSGGSSATTFTPTAGAGQHYVRYGTAGSLTNGTTYTMRVWAKFGGAAYIVFGDTGGGAWAWGSVKASDLSTSTNGTVSGSVKTPIALGGGVYLLEYTWTRDATSAVAPAIFPYSNTAASIGNAAYPSWTPTGAENITILGVQIEPGSFGTSPIPTAATSVTRAADVVQFTGAALTALQGSAGSAITETISLSGTSPASITNLIRGTNSILYRDTTGKTGTTNGTTALLTAAAPTWNVSLRNGLAWSAAGRSLVYTSGAVATDANAVSNGGTLYLGSNNGSAVENGWYKSFAIYNQRLPDAILQSKSIVGATY